MNFDSLVKYKGHNYLVPFILISSLFLLWGTAHSLLDVLNKHFQDALGISKATSGLVQFAMYGGYFLAALPAGWFIRRFGYRKGIILGLLMFAAGAFMFIPVTFIGKFGAVLAALFVIACGLAFLETAANPYSTILGPPESADRRINMSQSFNGIGWIIGPLAGLIIFGGAGGAHFEVLALPYTILGGSVLIVALLFSLVPLPEIEEEQDSAAEGNVRLLTNRLFVFAVVAQFLYVAAQTGINSMFINYVVENTQHINIAMASFFGAESGSGIFATPESTASVILAFGGMGCFFLGRFTGSFIMRRVKGGKLLMVYSIANVILMALTVGNFGFFSIVTLFLSYFFMSIMFPTIFSLGVRGMGSERKRASSYLIMAIVGGAFCPFIMGWIADHFTMSLAFIVPLICFGVILWFAMVAGKARS
jgi:FHS family L-fucose permease-like MFS transporter